MRLILVTFFVFFFNQSNGQVDSCVNFFTGNQINSIAESKKSIWFATECRLVEFKMDSNQLQFHSHRSNMGEECFSYDNYKLLVDYTDNIWLGGTDGIYKFDGVNWQTIVGFKLGMYYKLLGVDSKNQVWYTSDSLTRVSSSGNQTFSFKNYINTIENIAFDTSNNLWATTNQFGLIKFKDSITHIYTASNSQLPSNYLRALMVDKMNHVWVSGEKPNKDLHPQLIFVARYDGNTWSVHTAATGLPDVGRIFEITEDSNQFIWCLGEEGLATFNGTEWKVVKKRDKFSSESSYTHFLMDKMNNKWLGTNGSGPLKLVGNDWERIRTSNSGLPGNKVEAIGMDKINKLWVGTSTDLPVYKNYYQGLASFDYTNWMDYSSSPFEGTIPFKANAIISDSKKNLWVANERFLYKYDGLNWEKYQADLLGTISMTKDLNDNIWLASTSRELRMFDGKDWTYYSNDIYGFPWGYYNKTVEVDLANNVWISTYNHLAKFDGNTWQIIKCNKKSGASCWGLSIQTMAFDSSNNLWLGSDSEGLIYFNGTTFYKYKTKNQGTDYNNIQTILIDKKNNIWAGTFGNGLIKYDGKNWIQFNTSNSTILNNDINTIKFLDNQLWVGTNLGLIKFNECGGDTITVNTEMFTGRLEYPNQTFNVHTYPNPVASSLTVTCQEKAMVDIYNIHGQLVTSILLENQTTELNLSDFPSGVYILQVKADKGIAVRKIIKQ